MNTFENPLQPEEDETKERVDTLVRIREMKEVLDRDVPEEYTKAWEEAREKIDALEQDIEKGKKAIENINELTEQDREFYEAFLVATNEQIQEILNDIHQKEEYFFTYIPQTIEELRQQVKKGIEKLQN